MNPLMLLAAAGDMPDWLKKLLGIEHVHWDADSKFELSWSTELPPPWVIGLIVVPAIFGIFYFVYRNERRDAGAVPKFFLGVIRSLLVLLIFFMLFGPALTVDKYKDRKAYILMLVDESESMGKKDSPLQLEDQLTVARAIGLGDGRTLTPQEADQVKGMTRLQIVQAALKNSSADLLGELEKKLNVQVYSFSTGKVTAQEPLDVQAILPLGKETAIGEAMKLAYADKKGQTVIGLILFSDGRSNSGQDPVDVSTQWAKQPLLSVYTVSPGVPRRELNIELLDLQALEAMIAGEKLDLKFRIKSFGFPDTPEAVGCYLVPLVIGQDVPQTQADIERRLEGAEPLKSKTLTLRGGEQEETFTISPRAPGNYALILKAAYAEGENTYEDNYLVQSLRVVDEKIKVLYVDHWPRWEYRFLKNALIRDDKIKAHILLTSADPTFPHDKSPGLESLKEFPSTLKELVEYDVLILGDVPLDTIGGEEAAKTIEMYSGEFGGGIIFMAGTEYNPGHYRGTTLDKILPIVPEDPGSAPSVSTWDRDLPYKLTPEGKKHIIMQMESDPDRNTKVWEAGDDALPGLPHVRYYVRCKRPKEGNAYPLAYVTDPTQDKPIPLFVTSTYGQGFVFFSATDETYRWRWLRGDYPYFYPFWQRTMYWARKGKLLGAQRYRISLEKTRFMPGDPVKIAVNAYDPDMRPLTQEKIEVFVEPPPPADRVTMKLDSDTSNNRPGRYVGLYNPTAVGEYRVWAGDTDDSNKAYKRFTVFVPNREEDKPIIDPVALGNIAQSSYHPEGEKTPRSGVKGYYQIDELADLAQAIRKSDLQLRDTEVDELWDAPIVYILFALLITTEWILRKLYRML